jgi:hypothetical protein
MQENAELMIADPPQFADLKFALKIASKKAPFLSIPESGLHSRHGLGDEKPTCRYLSECHPPKLGNGARRSEMDSPDESLRSNEKSHSAPGGLHLATYRRQGD